MDSSLRKTLLFFVLPTLALAAFFLFKGLAPPPPKPDVPNLSAKWFTPETARGEVLKTKTMVGNCYICHMAYVPDPSVIQPIYNHQKIGMAHGKNRRCFNCHYIADRNRFTGPGDRFFEVWQVPQLCGHCHGVQYTQWTQGTHGLRQGTWHPAATESTVNHGCTQCHDPHSPSFVYAPYAPPPIWRAIYHRIPAEEGEAKPHTEYLLKPKGDSF